MINFKKGEVLLLSNIRSSYSKEDYFSQICRYLYICLDKKQTVFVQLWYLTTWKLELVIFMSINSPSSTCIAWQKKFLRKPVEVDGTMSLKVWYYWQEMEKRKCIFLLARVCKQVIWKSSANRIYIHLPVAFLYRNIFNLAFDHLL